MYVSIVYIERERYALLRLQNIHDEVDGVLFFFLGFHKAVAVAVAGGGYN